MIGNMKFSPVIILVLLILGVRSAHALDQDSDGMSDVWQRIHNITTGDTATDIDGDGQSNGKEAEAGTNPHNPNDFFRTSDFSINPTFDEVSLSWRSVEARYYEIQKSTDLVSWSYSSYGYGAYNQTTTSATFTPYLPGQSKMFFRVRGYPAYDYDSDGDGLQSWEERLLGTDPNDFDGDTDNDGMSDGWEFINQLNPLSAADAAADLDSDGVSNYWEFRLGYNPRSTDTDGNGTIDGEGDFDNDGLSDRDELETHNTNPSEPDSDGDGASDGDEIRNGTDPNSANSHSPVWRGVYSSIQYDFDDYPPSSGGRRGYLTISASWDASLNSTTSISSEIAWPDLSGRLDSEAPLPQTMPTQTGGLAAAYGYAHLLPNPPCYHASLQHGRFWIESRPAPSTDLTRIALLVTERSVDGQPSTPVVQSVSATIPAGSTVSQPISLLPSFTTNPTGNTYHNESVNMSILPVELVLGTNKLDLLDTQKWEVKIVGSLPTGVTVTNYTFEMRRASETTWYQMKTGTSAVYTEKPRVAGKFKVAAILTVNGQTVRTNEADLEVQFPDANKILAGAGVQAHLDQSWQATLSSTTPTSRREEGFWIKINTKDAKYEFTATLYGPVVDNTAGAFISLGTKPADNPPSPLPNADGATYTISSFHTHTPTFYRAVGRPVGPSSADLAADLADNVNGFVFDYVGDTLENIPAGHPLNSTAKIYNSGHIRRTTP